MKLTKQNIKIICELEEIIGSECYNPNSLNGWTLEEGCAFRYPVTYTNNKGEERKRWSVIDDLNAENLNSVRYKFGSNNLFIGSALKKILEYLEINYNIDFNKLTNTSK